MIILGAIAEGAKKIKHYNCRKGNINHFNRLKWSQSNMGRGLL